MIKLKTISGQYDTVYDLEHNNRSFILKNATLEEIYDKLFEPSFREIQSAEKNGKASA